MAKNSLGICKKELLLYINMAYAIRRLPRPWNWAAARWPRPYSGITGQVPLRTGLAMVDQRSWVLMLSVISRGCVWERDVWVLPAFLQRFKGWGKLVSAQTMLRDVKRTLVAAYEVLVNSMPKRVKAVLENNGGHKKYWHFGPNLDFFTQECTHFCCQRFRHEWLCVELFWGDSKFTLLYKLYTHYFTL